MQTSLLLHVEGQVDSCSARTWSLCGSSRKVRDEQLPAITPDKSIYQCHPSTGRCLCVPGSELLSYAPEMAGVGRRLAYERSTCRRSARILGSNGWPVRTTRPSPPAESARRRPAGLPQLTIGFAEMSVGSAEAC